MRIQRFLAAHGVAFAAAAICLAIGIGIPLRARAEAVTSTTNQTVGFTLNSFVPCANGGAGETIAGTGSLHLLAHTTISTAGNVRCNLHFQPQGFTAIGLTTGDTYQATGATNDTLSLTGGASTETTLVNNFRLIGPGPDNNLTVHTTLHITVNANGDVTASVLNSRVECN